MASEIKVYKVHDGIAEVATINTDLKTLQQAVGGYIETIKLRGKLTVLCDEDAFLKYKERSAIILTDKGALTIRGDFIVCNMGSKFYSISDNDLKIIKNTVKLY